MHSLESSLTEDVQLLHGMVPKYEIGVRGRENSSMQLEKKLKFIFCHNFVLFFRKKHKFDTTTDYNGKEEMFAPICAAVVFPC